MWDGASPAPPPFCSSSTLSAGMGGWGVWGERVWEQRAAEPSTEGQEVGAGLCMGRGAFVQQEWLRETKRRGWGAAAGRGLGGGWVGGWRPL